MKATKRSVSENPVVGPRASVFLAGKDGEAGDIGVYRRCSRTPSSRKTSRSKPDRILRQAPRLIWSLFLCSAAISGLVWGLPVVGRVDTFENGTTQGWSGSYSDLTPLPMHISGGGPAGPNDSYIEISTDGFHLATRNTSRAWTGNFHGVGVKAISMDLAQLAGNSDVRLRLALFGPGGMFATVARTDPLNERAGWSNHTFHLGIYDLVHVSGGTGRLPDTFGQVTTVLIRHDSATPTAPGRHPPHIRAAVGIDNITAVLRDYDVAWEFGSRDSDAYLLSEIEPSHVPIGDLNGENPNLALVGGQRYQILLEDPETHPLELIAKGADMSDDEVLLSMSPGVAGTFEDNEGVDWIEMPSGSVTFSLTDDLWAAFQGQEDQVPGYRCASHPQTMRGNFIITE
ncbi:MAG: hypothetical protein GY809_01495 [Planctomycetes bacterium]|nr:hypothetical protein [Planctomycetota bacterium]